MSKRVLDLQTDELIKRYGMRYAREWYMRSQDKLHLYLAQVYTDKQCKKIAVLAGTNTAILVVMLLFSAWKKLSKYR